MAFFQPLENCDMQVTHSLLGLFGCILKELQLSFFIPEEISSLTCG